MLNRPEEVALPGHHQQRRRQALRRRHRQGDLRAAEGPARYGAGQQEAGAGGAHQDLRQLRGQGQAGLRDHRNRLCAGLRGEVTFLWSCRRFWGLTVPSVCLRRVLSFATERKLPAGGKQKAPAGGKKKSTPHPLQKNPRKEFPHG